MLEYLLTRRNDVISEAQPYQEPSFILSFNILPPVSKALIQAVLFTAICDASMIPKEALEMFNLRAKNECLIYKYAKESPCSYLILPLNSRP